MSASQPPIANLDCNDSGLSTTSSVIALLTFLAAVILSIYVRIISMHRSLDKIRDLKDKIRDRQDEALRVLRDMSALRIGDQVEWEYWVENNADWERLSFDYTELYRKVGAKWFGSKEPHVLEGLVWFARWGRWTQKALEELLNAYEDLSDRSTSGSNSAEHVFRRELYTGLDSIKADIRQLHSIVNGGQENQINAASSDTEQGSGGSSDVTQLETKNQKLEVEVQALKQQINALQNASASRAMMPSTQARET